MLPDGDMVFEEALDGGVGEDGSTTFQNRSARFAETRTFGFRLCGVIVGLVYWSKLFDVSISDMEKDN